MTEKNFGQRNRNKNSKAKVKCCFSMIFYIHTIKAGIA